jgi:hypothetical protein
MVERRLAVTLLLACLLASGCVDPKDRRPGLRLSGDVVSEPVEDWSFTDAQPEIFVEVSTPYLLPHSVTIVCTTIDGQLYLWALNPSEKRWVAYVERDPDVRLEIGDAIYEQRLETVDDPELREAIYRSFAAKYARDVAPPEERPEFRAFRVVERR